MADNAIPGPSGLKKLRFKNPKALTEEELEYLAYFSDSEDEPFQDSGSEWSGESEIAEDLVPDKTMELEEEVDLEQPVEPRQMAIDFNWVEQPSELKKIPFTGQHGLKVNIPGEGRPIDFFRLIADDTFFDLLVNQTNIYAESVFINNSNPRPHSRISRWKPVDKAEMLRFTGILLHMGIIQVPRLRDYWRTDRLYNLPFRHHMSRNRFLLLLRCLHFSLNPQEGEPLPNDRLFKVRPLVDFFNNKMLEIYTPQKELAIDESMLLWRGRLLFRQYIKNKKHKYGIKFYLLTESTGTVMKMQIYAGAADDMGGQGHAANVVLHLVNSYLDQGYSLYMDNYYNSVSLARQLIERNTFCTGTLRNGRKGSPTDVAKAKLGAGESIQRYAANVCVGKWRDKRDVLYISTEHENIFTEVTSRSGRAKQKPLPIAEYNKYMSGIDLQDQMLSYYPSNRKTIRWYKKVGIHVIEIMLYNSYMLYNKYSTPKMSFLDFRHSVIESLLPQPEMEVPQNIPAQHVPAKLKTAESGRKLRKRCRICFENGVRKDSMYYCPKCSGGPGLCLEPCFEQFHRNK